MILDDLRNESLYIYSLGLLSDHRKTAGAGFGGRFVQIFLGLKFYQESIPSIYSGRFIGSELLQSLLDDLYAKWSRPANHCVLSLFEASYKARTGLIAPGNISAQNTWRNNLNLQKGIGCYAPVSELSSPTFLDEPRVRCRHLIPSVSGEVSTLANARCSLNPGGAKYRKESHRKWLRIDPGGNGYASVDLGRVSNFAPLIAPAGRRLPLVPVMRALYFDSNPGLVVGQREVVSISDFMMDFNFSPAEMEAYFDYAELGLERSEVLALTLTEPDDAKRTRDPVRTVGKVREMPELYIPESGTVTLPPALNTGWSAEQFAHSALVSAGWEAHLVSRQNLGYDIFAQKGKKKIYVEVKSSLASCAPTLTSREWFQANHYGGDYILAIIENFNEMGSNQIFWVPDPASRCSAVEAHSISYRVPRSAWGACVVNLRDLERGEAREALSSVGTEA